MLLGVGACLLLVLAVVSAPFLLISISAVLFLICAYVFLTNRGSHQSAVRTAMSCLALSTGAVLSWKGPSGHTFGIALAAFAALYAAIGLAEYSGKPLD